MGGLLSKSSSFTSSPISPKKFPNNANSNTKETQSWFATSSVPSERKPLLAKNESINQSVIDVDKPIPQVLFNFTSKINSFEQIEKSFNTIYTKIENLLNNEKLGSSIGLEDPKEILKDIKYHWNNLGNLNSNDKEALKNELSKSKDFLMEYKFINEQQGPHEQRVKFVAKWSGYIAAFTSPLTYNNLATLFKKDEPAIINIGAAITSGIAVPIAFISNFLLAPAVSQPREKRLALSNAFIDIVNLVEIKLSRRHINN